MGEVEGGVDEREGWMRGRGGGRGGCTCKGEVEGGVDEREWWREGWMRGRGGGRGG